MSNSSNDLAFSDLVPGQREHHVYEVTPAVHEGFLTVFGDRNPIHVDEVHARARGFSGRLMHGGLMNGFLSHFVGMVFPGRRGLLLSVDIRYLQPVYLGARLRLDGEVKQKVESERLLVLDFQFTDLGREVVVARGRSNLRFDQDG